MNLLRVCIAEGNEKLGAIPNVSLLPGVSCPECAQDTCLVSGCYAAKLCKLRPGVAQAWAANFLLATTQRDYYFREITDWLMAHKPAAFRWHVGGDLLDQDYLDKVIRIALLFPDTRFLAFTKRDDLEFKWKPKNLSIVFSCWPSAGMPKSAGPFCWMLDPHKPDPRILDGTFVCPGSCSDCMACWALEPGDHMLIKKH